MNPEKWFGNGKLNSSLQKNVIYSAKSYYVYVVLLKKWHLDIKKNSWNGMYILVYTSLAGRMEDFSKSNLQSMSPAR